LATQRVSKDFLVAMVAVNVGMIKGGDANINGRLDKSVKHIRRNGMPAPRTSYYSGKKGSFRVKELSLHSHVPFGVSAEVGRFRDHSQMGGVMA
jgi:hypothetical protein